MFTNVLSMGFPTLHDLEWSSQESTIWLVRRKWGPERAFHKLGDAVTSAPVLALPVKGLPFTVDTDASLYQDVCTLFQMH